MFTSNTLSWSEGIRTEGVVRAPYADARIAPIDERDIAAVAVRAMLTDAMAGTTPLLTGPEQLTQADQVRSISRAIGVPLRFEEVAPRPPSPPHRRRQVDNSAVPCWATTPTTRSCCARLSERSVRKSGLTREAVGAGP